ncbi:CDP-diacylglycerol diphosphatase [Shewanella sp. YIC-542]|uniref:CDP-diacylglycerol diphosphatase n=1 Tax=Shewanella mytili TaxID=3377111 RepID=UPI00398F27C9
MFSTLRKRWWLSALLLITLVAVSSYVWRTSSHNSDALWQLISQRCVPALASHGVPTPCQEVNQARGYVTLKDRNGILQYLLMPLNKLAGMESPELLHAATPNFFALAWEQRQLAVDHMTSAQTHVPDSALSLAINSQYGRTQNQLHIHISCLRQDVRQQLDALTPSLTSRWQTHPLGPNDYLLRTLQPQELHQTSAFIRLAQELPDAAGHMGHYGLALANLPNGQLVLMAIRANWRQANKASAEELQDHSCQILQSAS